MQIHPLITKLLQIKRENHTLQEIKSSNTPSEEITPYAELDPIEKLELPVKIQNALKKRNVNTIGKFYKYKRKRLKKIKFIGPKALKYLMRVKKEICIEKSDVEVNYEEQNLKENNKLNTQAYASQDFSYVDLNNMDLPKSISRDDNISVLNLPIRLENSLRRNGEIEIVGQFCDYDEKALFQIRNVGSKAYLYLLKIKKELELNPVLNAPEKLKEEEKYKVELMVDTPEVALEKLLNKANLTGSDPIEILGLPTRVENALKIAGIENLNLFFLATKKEIIESRNLGNKSFELITKYKDAIENGVISGIQDEELVDITLNRCENERARTIVMKRYGLLTGVKETLEEIGENLNITRERVRQIQKKSLTRMKHPSTKSRQRLKELIEKVCMENDGVITDREADDLIPELIKNSSIDGSSFLDLVSDIGWIQSNQVGDVLFYSPKFNMLSLPSLMTEVLQILKRNRALLDAKTIVQDLSCRDLMDREKLILLVFRCCKLDPRINEKIEGKFTPFSGMGTDKAIWITIISQILSEARVPLHWEVITQRLNERLINPDQHLDQRRIHFLLIDNPEFALSGKKGRYGLVDWGFRKDSTLDLVVESLRKAGSPLSWREIYTYVHKYKDTKPINIIALLNNKNNFIRQDGGYWFKKILI